MPTQMDLTPQSALSLLVTHVLDMERHGRERLAVGLAGGPGAGKSTLASELVTMLNATRPGNAALVPMDGFHMRHAKLKAMGQVDYKGAPHTFEGADFVNFLSNLKHTSEPMKGPAYSRKIEDVVDDAFEVAADVRVLVVEGNYLLLPEPPWAGIKPLLDFSVYLNVPRDTVRARLMRRHAEEGLFTAERNQARIERNDLPNYDLISEFLNRSDLVINVITER